MKFKKVVFFLLLSLYYGYVISKIQCRVLCRQCRSALFSFPGDTLHPKALSFLKSNSKEISIPSNSVFKIVRSAEQVLEQNVLSKFDLPMTPNLLVMLSNKVIRGLSLKSLFPTLDGYVLEQNPAKEEVHSYM